MGKFKTTVIIAIGLVAGWAVGVAAQDAERAAPVEFTATWALGPQIASETSGFNDGVTEYRGGPWRPAVVEMSDSRLSGIVTVTPNHDTYGSAGGAQVWNGVFRIENDGGAWQ